MNRREVMQTLSLVSSHALFPSILSGFVASCSQPEQEDYSPIFFDQQEFRVIREVIDIILPATQTKSASEANTHHFLDEIFAKCLSSDQQNLIKKGLAHLASRWSSEEDRGKLVATIDQKSYAGDENFAYFKAIKQYTLLGFFTSQEGVTKASNYVKIPGDYKGEFPIDENTLNYGNTNLRFYL